LVAEVIDKEEADFTKEAAKMAELRLQHQKTKKITEPLSSEVIKIAVEELIASPTSKSHTISVPSNIDIAELRKVITKEVYNKSSLKLNMYYKDYDTLLSLEDVNDWRDLVVFLNPPKILVEKK